MDPKVRQKVLSEWRGYWEPRPRPDRQKAVGEVLPGLMKQLGLSERYSEQEMQAAWREIVGDFLAQHSHPLRLRQGVLQVQVQNPSVHYELSHKWKAHVLGKLRQRFGAAAVKEIRYVLG